MRVAGPRGSRVTLSWYQVTDGKAATGVQLMLELLALGRVMVMGSGEVPGVAAVMGCREQWLARHVAIFQ